MYACEYEIIEKYIKFNDYTLDYVFLTHEHYDHIKALNELRDNFNFLTVSTLECSEGIQKSNYNMSKYFNVLIYFKEHRNTMEICEYYCKPADYIMDNNEIFNWYGIKFRFVKTPGHSKGSTFIFIDNKMLLSGDTLLFKEKIYTKFVGGSKKEYEEITVPIIDNLNEGLRIFPGHGEEYTFYKED